MLHRRDQSKVCYISCIGTVQYTRTTQFLHTLVADGFNVMAICPGELTEQADRETIAHYPLPKPKTNFWYDAGLINTLYTIWQRIRNSILLIWLLIRKRPDIIICSEPDSWTIAVLGKWFFGNKVIADLREVYDDRALAFPQFIQGFTRNLLRKLMRGLSRFTDEVIHVSLERQQVYSYLTKTGVVIGSYPRLSLFPLRSACDIDQDVGLVTAIHVGALRPTYASAQLLEAMSIVAASTSNLRFVVLGGITGTIKNAELIDSLKDEGVLELLQQVPFSKVVDRLNASDIGINLVLPVDTAHRLAAPQKLYEYFAANLPVVAADVPTIRRVITEHKCGIIVDPFSPEAIAEALIKLSQDDGMRKMMGYNGRLAVETEYNWESQASKLRLLVRSFS